MAIFLHILGNNIIPIFILILLGFLFVNLYSTNIPSGMFKVIEFAFIFMTINALSGLLATKVCKLKGGIRSVFQNSLMFYNSGNFGFPLISLVFSSSPFVIKGETPYLNIAITAQIIIMVFQDLTTNTLGFINAGSANVNFKESLKKVFKMPIIY